MPSKLDLDLANSKYGKNELLHKAIDRAVLRGAMRIEAARDALDMYGEKCLVDEKDLSVTLNGLPLDEALEKIISERKLWQPTGDDPAVKARSELEAAALAGSVTAHGQLFKELGSAGYEAWKKQHAAAPGKAAAPEGMERDPVTGQFIPKGPADDDGATNPFTKAGWNLTSQGQIAKRDPALAARLAKAAGVVLGATRPVK
jgi:hypothetical protein